MSSVTRSMTTTGWRSEGFFRLMWYLGEGRGGVKKCYPLPRDIHSRALALLVACEYTNIHGLQKTGPPVIHPSIHPITFTRPSIHVDPCRYSLCSSLVVFTSQAVNPDYSQKHRCEFILARTANTHPPTHTHTLSLSLSLSLSLCSFFLVQPVLRPLFSKRLSPTYVRYSPFRHLSMNPDGDTIANSRHRINASSRVSTSSTVPQKVAMTWERRRNADVRTQI